MTDLPKLDTPDAVLEWADSAICRANSDAVNFEELWDKNDRNTATYIVECVRVATAYRYCRATADIISPERISENERLRQAFEFELVEYGEDLVPSGEAYEIVKTLRNAMRGDK